MTNQEVYIYERNEIFDSPESVSKFLRVEIGDVMIALRSKNGYIAGLHICWNRNRRTKLYKPICIIEKDQVFPSIRHMSYFYNINQDEIRNALLHNHGFFHGWHLEFVDHIPEPTYHDLD